VPTITKAGDVAGLRLAIRTRLYHDRRNSFGCEQPDCTCEQHLQLEGLPEEVDHRALTRIRHLTRLESMINVGCTFGPDDLSYEQWSDLIILATERQWMDARIEEQRDRIRDAKQKADAAMTEARKQSGTPPPGQSLFSGKKA